MINRHIAHATDLGGLVSAISSQGRDHWTRVSPTVDHQGKAFKWSKEWGGEKKAGKTVYQHKLTDKTMDAVPKPLRGALTTAQNDPALQGKSWSVEQGQPNQPVHTTGSGPSTLTADSQGVRYTLAAVAALKPGEEWTLFEYPTYSLSLDSKTGALAVGIAEAALFSVEDAGGLVDSLDNGELPKGLEAAFGAHGLKPAPSVEVEVGSPGSDWSLTQTPSAGDAVGYNTYRLVAIDGSLGVFGSELLSERLGPGNQLELVIIDVVPTKLKAEQLSPDAVCPNGTSYGVNQDNRRTWLEMMTPVDPLDPPSCVPSDDGWCPSVATTDQDHRR